MTNPLPTDRETKIRSLFDEYIELYASRDDRLTTRFSENFSGYTGGGDFLVKDRAQWVKITRQDFSQVPQRIRIEMIDLSMQDISQDVVVVTAFFHIHLPGPEHVLSREVARLVLIFRCEGEDWKIVHSGISIPYHLVQEGEVYPLKGLQERNRALETLVDARTKELRESEALYRLLTEETLDVVWKADSNLRITYISPADERLRGYRAEEVLGHHVFEMFTDDGVTAVTALLKKGIREHDVSNPNHSYQSFTVQHRCKDGRLLWGEVLSKYERDANGKIAGYHGVTREITERIRLEDEVRQLAFFDPLTKLPNRRLLTDRLNQVMVSSKRSGIYAALMFMDLDNFKPLNDLHGHDAGDLLLVEAARRLGTSVRGIDTVARFGGDEFVVILNELEADRAASIDMALKVAEKIRANLSVPYSINVRRKGRPDCIVEHHCSVSIGVVVFIDRESTSKDVLKEADLAMYQAKGEGRNLVRFFEVDDMT